MFYLNSLDIHWWIGSSEILQPELEKKGWRYRKIPDQSEDSMVYAYGNDYERWNRQNAYGNEQNH